MNWSKNLYVFMLGAIIVFSGCFGTGTSNGDDGDADDTSTSGTTIINNYYNNTTPSNGLNWYTSGGTYNLFWNMDNVNSNGRLCLVWGVDGCQSYGGLDVNNPWDTTECTGAGGYTTTAVYYSVHNRQYSNAPSCTIEFTSINTSSGEALLIYQSASITMETTCNDGVAVSTYHMTSKEYTVVTGSSMNCTHILTGHRSYDDQYTSNPNNAQNEEMGIWSILYAIQDATVV